MVDENPVFSFKTNLIIFYASGLAIKHFLRRLKIRIIESITLDE